MKLENFSSDLHELSSLECSAVTGGESIWYWVSYGVGSVVRAYNDYQRTKEDWGLIGLK